MIINGKEIAKEVRERARSALARAGKTLSLGVVSVGSDAVTKQFIAIKKKAADEIGISVREIALPENTSMQDVVDAIQKLTRETHGIIVQLPLPSHIDRLPVLSEIPTSHDVDCLGAEARSAFEKGESMILPPVVAAMKEILEREGVSIAGKKVVVIGKGMLVGAPAAAWFAQQGTSVASLDEHDDLAVHTKDADIIVLGAGQSSLLKPDMIQEAVIILDGGTSESAGKVVGDADPACASKASLFTPVPGGIGPVAVAKIFENLATLQTLQS